ncbi:MAG: PAS domain S-box-containing protein [Paracoccaceae bacterium]|jgi:PAS domain S-box-containing protein
MNASATITTEFEDSFRSISNPNPQPMILTGLDGVVIVANPAAVAQGVADTARMADLFGPGVEAFLKRAARTADGVFDRFEIASGAASDGVRLHGGLVRPTGPEGPALVSVTLTPMAQAQRAFSALTMQIDQLNSEIARRSRAEQHLRAVIDMAFDGVLILDIDGRILTFSPACERVLGVTAAAAQGRGVEEFISLTVPPDLAVRDVLRGLARKEDGVSDPYETVGMKVDGEIFPIEIQLEKVQRVDDTFLVATVHNLTERKALESQLVEAQKMQLVGRLASGVAHDFNNLLTVMIGNAELLLETLHTGQDMTPSLQDMIAAGRRGAKLTRSLLSFGRGQRLSPQPTDVNPLIEKLLRLMRRALKAGPDIITDLQSDLKLAMVDPSQLEDAIMNLALNARDAMPGGGLLKIKTANITLSPRHARIHPEVEPGHFVVIAITDTGEGMSPEVLEHACEPFYTTKSVGHGSGLGLSQAYGFVKQSMGQMSIFSEPGLGTTIRIYLPVAEDASTASENRPASPEHGARPCTTVLIIEEDPIVRGLAMDCVTAMGHRALSAKDDRVALRMLKSASNIDLLVAEVLMTGGGRGADLARNAEASMPGIKVLLTSGYASEALERAGYACGDYDLLSKPYRPADLQRHLAALLA